MTLIPDLLRAGPTLSFEFFPPKTDGGMRALQRTMDRLAVVEPDFVSVTYGAGGSTQGRTRDLVVDITRERPYPAMAHLTCVGHTREALAALLEDYSAHGVHNILALAGDPPEDGSDPGGDFTYASELVELVNGLGQFSVAVAAQPELHPRSTDRSEDRRYLATKLAASDFAVTQFFFDASDYRRMVDELDALGVDRPVLPGIMPVINPASIRRFADGANAKRPTEMWARLDSLVDDPDALLDAAVDYACQLVSDLLDEGVPGIHIYALNKADASLAICERMNLVGQGANE